MARQWIIGAGPGVDLLVKHPTVSSRHCRLLLVDDTYYIEDLTSSNGTFLNGATVTERTRVSPADAITLGPDIPMPWPPELISKPLPILTIGRERDNDIVVNSPVVSGHHARVVGNGNPDEAVIEDLGSSNGISLNHEDKKIATATFTPQDVIFLGTVPLLGSHLIACLDPSATPAIHFHGESLLIGRDPACQFVIDQPNVSGRHARLIRSHQRLWIEDLGSSNGTFVNAVLVEKRRTVEPGDILGFGTAAFRLNPAGAPRHSRNLAPTIAYHAPVATTTGGPNAPEFATTFVHFWKRPTHWMNLLLIAPVAALLIALVFRGREGSASAILFWTGFVAVGCGLIDAFAGRIFDRSPSRWTFPRLSALACANGILGVLQTIWIWAMVSKLTDLGGEWLPALGLVILGAGVGIALGLLIASQVTHRVIASAILGALLVAFALLGGGTRMPGAVRPLSNAIPTRWVYEGLLLHNADPQLVEAQFPAQTEQMGLRADVMALAFMLVGFSAGGAFLAMQTPRRSSDA